MLTSFNHYACYYYALLCLLQQHYQQVAAITIIVDGVQTNEWATRDAYQRGLYDPAIVNTLGLASQRLRQSTFNDGIPPDGFGGGGGLSGSGGFAGDSVEMLDDSAAVAAIPASASGEAVVASAAAAAADESSSKINPLVEIMQPSLRHQQIPQHHQQQPRRRKVREKAAKRYCGEKLMLMLEMVCGARFFDGKEPEVVPPSIKTRRSPRESYDKLLGNSQQQQLLRLDDQDHDDDDGGDPQREASDLDGGTNGSGSSSMEGMRNNRALLGRNRFHGRPLLRRIRGASEDCCKRACHEDELKLYCEVPR